ncbi:MAG: transcription-repair coupling factor, partial [Clostridia bacterium]
MQNKEFFDNVLGKTNLFCKKKEIIDAGSSLLIEGFTPSLIGVFFSDVSPKVVLVCGDLSSATKIQAMIRSFDKRCEMLLSPLELASSLKSRSSLYSDVIKTLYSFILGEIDVLLCLPSFLFQKLPSKEKMLSKLVKIAEYDEIEIDQFCNKLLSAGYNKAEAVTGCGEFSVHGDIVEVFDLKSSNIVRISFFDFIVEEIKILDFETYLPKEKVAEFCFLPQSLFFVEDEEKDDMKMKIKNKLYESKLKGENLFKLSEKVSALCEQVENNCCLPLFLLPFAKNVEYNVLSFDPSCILAFEEAKKICDEIEIFEKSFVTIFSSLLEGGEVFCEHANFYLPQDKCLQKNERNCKFCFQNIFLENNYFRCNVILKEKAMPSKKYLLDYKQLLTDLKVHIKNGIKVFLMAGSGTAVKNIGDFFASENLRFKENLDGLAGEAGGAVYLLDCQIGQSFSFLKENILVIGTDDLVKSYSPVSHANKKTEVFYLPKIGDFVVHEIHGIGKCVCIERLKLGKCEKDYFIIEYRGGDRLYVPSEQANMISAFMGSDADPKLSKIGGEEFAKTKQKVLDSIESMTKDLIALYAERNKKKGFCYSPDTYLQKMFENAFPFEETDDQLSAISAIKKDMESGKVMDRLICGDVGYGKTEVAIRAAFKAIADGKQVAFLCPTTILSQQHFATCKERFCNFMTKIEVLNRFKTTKEQKDILKRLSDGEIDLICGTQSLLSENVKFNNLGLLIIDEEQRFGVSDKEKIKQIKKDVDVICMSATPIPRTLHMALSGIRDVSIIETPPKERLPIETFVTEFSFPLLASACKKEVARDGQVFVIYNRVETIENFAEKVKKDLPDLRIGVCHGQMPEKMLESVIERLYNKEYDILISTTLIENGVDLPSANTLFVVDSDRLGLSQLYQLRGRIGRSNKLGFAYFTYDPDKILTEQAFKRLEAILQFTELGSGFKIAMRDLEIRGAGNVLGKKQHGQLEKVGYDLYCKILNDSLKKARGEKVLNKREVKMQIALSAFIPRDFIEKENQRIKAYTNLSMIETKEDLNETIASMHENFGKIPDEVLNLANIAYLKNMAQKLEMCQVSVAEGHINFCFYEKEKMLLENIVKVVNRYDKFVVLKFETKPIIEIKLGAEKGVNETLDFAISFANQL